MIWWPVLNMNKNRRPWIKIVVIFFVTWLVWFEFSYVQFLSITNMITKNPLSTVYLRRSQQIISRTKHPQNKISQKI